MRALITGCSGFVANHLACNLLDNGYEVWGGTRRLIPSIPTRIHLVEMNFSQQQKLIDVLESIRPTVIFHLSGQSSVKHSWNHIDETFQSNLMDTLALFEAVKNSSIVKNVMVISIGSSEEYGFVKELPIFEEEPANPLNPYGLSKLTISRVVPYYTGLYGLNIIHTRAFNHIGPGQKLGFVASDFAKQVVDIEVGKVEPVLYVGDLSSKRDFTDVRDIVEAYRLVAERGESGQIYNICSGTCISVRSILDMLVSFSSRTIEIIVDEKKMRPNDVKEYYGSNKKIKLATGWKPSILLEDSLYDIYRFWKNGLLNEF